MVNETKEINMEDIPESVWLTYINAFLNFQPNEQRRPLGSIEKQIGQLERRIVRKKGQESHQILADMKELQKALKDGDTLRRLYQEMENPELEELLQQGMYLSRLIGRTMD